MSVFTNPSSSSREQARAYTAAILGLVGDADPLEILRTTPATLREAIAAVAPDRLSVHEAPGKWSIRQVVQHLADSEIVFSWRLRLVLAHDQPEITGYDQDRWAERLGYDDVDVELAMDTFEILRRGNVQLLARSTPEALTRYGVHAERGNESVAHMMRMYAGHDTLHLQQIDRIRDTDGRP
jgi:hypothetical protein